MFEITLPLPTYKQKGKRKLLGLNAYRNLHFHVLHKAKQDYTQIVATTLARQQLSERISDNAVVLYMVYFERKNRKDLPNYSTIIDKFFLDAIVEVGILKDDKVPFISGSFALFGGYGEDKVDIYIGNIDEIVNLIGGNNEKKLDESQA